MKTCTCVQLRLQRKWQTPSWCLTICTAWYWFEHSSSLDSLKFVELERQFQVILSNLTTWTGILECTAKLKHFTKILLTSWRDGVLANSFNSQILHFFKIWKHFTKSKMQLILANALIGINWQLTNELGNHILTALMLTKVPFQEFLTKLMTMVYGVMLIN